MAGEIKTVIKESAGAALPCLFSGSARLRLQCMRVLLHSVDSMHQDMAHWSQDPA
jgi:hypothetical protein